MASPDTDQNDAPRGYVENPNHVPNPTDMYGTLETSGTGGAAQGRIEEVTPIFDVAKAADLDTARRALDPDDPTDPSLVVLSEGQPLKVVDRDAEAQKIKDAAARAVDQPVDLSSSRVTPPLADAARSNTSDVASSQQSDQGASGGIDGGGAGSTGDAADFVTTEPTQDPTGEAKSEAKADSKSKAEAKKS